MSEPDAPSPAQRPTRRWRRAAVALALTAVLGTAGAELFLRWRYGFGDHPIVLADPRTEYRFAPGRAYRRLGSRMAFNAYSMRGDDFPPRKASPDERRVMVIGDSVVNGGARVDQAELATTLLQSRLRRDLGAPTLVVGNISAGSWGPQNQLGYVEKFGLFDADVAVIVVSGHDATDEMGPLPDRERPLNRSTFALAELWGVLRYRLTHGDGSAGPTPGAPGRAGPCLAAFEALLARVARETGRPAIVAFHRERAESGAGTEPSGLALLRAACARHGVEPIALADANHDAGREAYLDHIHPNALGHQRIADALAPRIESALRAAVAPATRPGG